MEVFRLARLKYAMPLSGKGAALKGGRWNSAGTELIYTAANRSLAMAEVAVHLTLATLPIDYVMVTINIPSKVSRFQLSEEMLPPHWKEFPSPAATQAVGDRFVKENKYCLLIIPSAITQGDFNVLINPNHAHFKQIQVKEVVGFPIDKRMVR
jgi:RES domain-containing protein